MRSLCTPRRVRLRRRRRSGLPNSGGPRCGRRGSGGSPGRPSTADEASPQSTSGSTSIWRLATRCRRRRCSAAPWEWCAPTILAHGSDWLKEEYLGRLFRGEILACQLLSEPGAGSDLASLSTRATADGDEWVINGQKVWSSRAHFSDIGLLLARTDSDAPKHKGITALIYPLDTPGTDVRPLRQMTGGSEFNEVFFDDARIGDRYRVGDVNAGWSVFRTALQSERASIGSKGAGYGGSGLVGLAAPEKVVQLAPTPRPIRRPGGAPRPGLACTPGTGWWSGMPIGSLRCRRRRPNTPPPDT